MAKQQRRTPRNSKQSTPGWAWLLAGLVAGLFVAFLVYLQGQRDTQPQLPPIPRQSESKPQQPQLPPVAAEKPAKPRFDFYTILPEMEIPVPEPDPEPRISPPPRPAAPQQPSPPTVKQAGVTAYVLQLGSFRNRADADRLKAKITMLGFEPHIQTVNINGSDWYRVRIGPYSNSVRIAEVRHRLRENELDAILLKLKD
ncbi:MAG TPA: SPOR domain-containing protein [Gammaproteobacteria bacterium]|nr:SPOR domain-containing protein [Gammaproteobacteria bacterium]